MRVLISGASGLIGTALSAELRAKGHETIPLTRRSARPSPSAFWDPVHGAMNLDHAGRLDAVVHLAGESIFGIWTPAKRARIRDSRLQGTRLLVDAISRLEARPSVLISASAIGYYGDRGEEVLREDSPSGTGFLAETCREWEAAAQRAATAGIRVAVLRFGIVLAREGGALRLMLPAFKAGLGGILGSGKQYMSWIGLPDLVQVISTALADPRYTGPINAVSPQPLTNHDFTKTLGKALRRPTVLPVPAPVLRGVLGGMGQELLLASQRVEPARLAALSFPFQSPTLDSALQGLI